MEQRAREIQSLSRVTYVEANLMRHLREEKPAQLAANAVYKYIEKYVGEVSMSAVHPWLAKTTRDVFQRHPPMVKHEGKLVTAKLGELMWAVAQE